MKTDIDSAKTVFLFPGVGAQQADMFAGFRAYPEYRACLEEVSDLAGLDLDAVIHGGRRDELKQVRTAQLALTATTVAIARILRQRCGWMPDFVMGHSLGQYPALCAAGYLDLATLTRVVSLRAQAAESCARTFQQGEMCWVLHVPAETVEREVEKARREDGLKIYVSAVDAFDQASVSGEMAEIRRFAPRIEALGGLFYPLRIGGPFHSPLMEEARAQLEAALDFLPPADQPRPLLSRLICNVSAAELPASGLKDSILQHLTSPVQWLRSLQYAARNGVTRYLEISPKSVLSYLVQRAGLPMLPVCEPGDLLALAEERSAPERRREHFVRHCRSHLYGEPLPAAVDEQAARQLRKIREEIGQRALGETPSREDCAFLLQRTRQWLEIAAAQGGDAPAMAQARLQSLYEAAEG
ncbi:ACP S-malonyltransferase [Chromobacterium subtsugae]|uniref:[acyl-carrier-protein] S-malonyltransferase n=1 Tax=Chromobacterium subtsugae TaxID=251747 RepID=A0ABS7FJA5_9NEIS|nr:MULTISPECIES: ACP S-malonyltransferase [Chromobacterium]KUM02145.1 ACP S-malonyltransferase [Chromobacterium subtsugae]KZE84167.1 ACP S-malonyltransferase [Chromobacterium sp. F49]MBW7569121.1 ACP S-malonyltransferase [Chromobacterium subtsugae]MBW8289801.1 ACP S-malonyltransferase [Chromobacterium subtsugae]WSE93678.1 ACP S-malonyltransferase [Chromobacterium subtsugae]